MEWISHDKTWLSISRWKNRVTSERDEDAGKKTHQYFFGFGFMS